MTRDEKTGEVTQIVKKIRLGDLNIYSPKRPADWRISVNMEVPGAFGIVRLDWWKLIRVSSFASAGFTDTYAKKG